MGFCLVSHDFQNLLTVLAEFLQKYIWKQLQLLSHWNNMEKMVHSVCLNQCQWKRDVDIHYDVSLYQRIMYPNCHALVVLEPNKTNWQVCSELFQWDKNQNLQSNKKWNKWNLWMNWPSLRCILVGTSVRCVKGTVTLTLPDQSSDTCFSGYILNQVYHAWVW